MCIVLPTEASPRPLGEGATHKMLPAFHILFHILLQATVGGLVAKTLSSAAAGPAVYAGRAGAAPPVALDVFSVQVGHGTT